MEWGGWCTKSVRGTHSCGLRKGINLRWDGFLQYIHFDVGEGNQVRFWHDRWLVRCGDQPLRMVFLDLYDCCVAKDALVDSLLGKQNEGVRT